MVTVHSPSADPLTPCLLSDIVNSYIPFMYGQVRKTLLGQATIFLCTIQPFEEGRGWGSITEFATPIAVQWGYDDQSPTSSILYYDEDCP